MMRLMSGGVLVVLAAARVCRGGDTAVARRITPWWEQASPAARSVERLRRKNLGSQSPGQREARAYRVPPVEGESGAAELVVHDLFASADAFHFPDDETKFQGGLYVVYEVLEPADVILRVDSGSAFWSCENVSLGKRSVFYTRGKWALSETGVFALDLPVAGWKSYTGAPFAKGAYVLDRVGMQLYHGTTGKHLKVLKPNKLASSASDGGRGAMGPDTWFTVADLTAYTIGVNDVTSDWGRSGYVGATVRLTDADGERFDLPGAEVSAEVSSGGPHETTTIRLAPRGGIYERGSIEYSYRFFGTYPEEFYDKNRITVKATVWVLGPDGLAREEKVEKTVSRDSSAPVPLQSWQNLEPRRPPRVADGRLCESRVLWVHGSYFQWWKSIENADQALRATKMLNANIFGGGVFFAGRSHVRTEKMVTLESVWEGPDVFEHLISQAHAAGIEVHPAVNCAIGGGGWGGPQLLQERPEWAVVDANGKRLNEGNASVSDLHRPEFRETFVGYVVDMARRYEIDGVKLDFTRTKQRCYCERCREEYRGLTGRDLADDSRPPYTPAYIKWQEDAVSALVRGIRQGLDSVRTGIKLSHWGHDEPGNPSYQGRRPDIWLNNGWIDWFEIGCYGGDPDAAVRTWSRIARMVDRPECVWPAFGFYIGNTASAPADSYVVIPRKNEFTGDGFHSRTMGCRRPKVLAPMVRAFRDQCGLNGLALFDLCQLTRAVAEAYGTELFTESAVPWFPALTREE